MQAPSSPNATATAATQAQYNKEAAVSQQNLNLIDQQNPFGSTTNAQSGTWSDGTPRYTQTTSFNPQVQGIIDNSLNTASTPFNADTDTRANYLMDLGSKRLDPALDRRRASTEQSLFNRGVRPGTEAYRRGMEAVSQGENDAYNQLLLTGQGQAFNELLAARNQPLNELNALRTGTQVNSATPQAGVNSVDYSGLVGQEYQQQQQQYQNTWNGIGNLAGAAGGWAFSDKRLKTGVRDTGVDTPDGIDIKSYRYKGSPMMHLGVIAQDAEKKRPDAVRTHPSGFKQVRYPSLMRMAG